MDMTSVSHAILRSPSSDDVDSQMEDEEVDQLVSDSEEDVQAPRPGSTNTSTKTRPRLPVERVPGRSVVPLSRIEALLEADGEESHMSKEALFLLGVATEEFVKRLAEAGHRTAHAAKRSIIYYKDVAAVATQTEQFKLLHDTIPQPISLAEALRLRATREKELVEESVPNPAPVPPAAPQPPQNAPGPKAKGKAKQVPESNGVVNGEKPPTQTANTDDTKRTKGKRSRKPQPEAESVSEKKPTATRGSRRQASRASQKGGGTTNPTDAQPSQANGHSPQTNGRVLSYHSSRSRPPNERGAWETTNPQNHSDPPSAEYDEKHFAAEYRPEEVWNPAAHFTGPASGFLEEHRVLFGGKNGMAVNPGRTIYNPHRQPNR